MNMFRKPAWLVGSLMVLVGVRFVAACSDDETSTPTTDSGVVPETGAETGPTQQNISGQVTYAGTKTGPATYVALITDKGGMGMPDPAVEELLFAKRLSSTFPVRYELGPVKPGTYVISGYLSVGDDHGQGPIPETDPQCLAAIKVEPGQANTVVNCALEDPPPAGDGGDGGDGGDAGADAPDAD